MDSRLNRLVGLAVASAIPLVCQAGPVTSARRSAEQARRGGPIRVRRGVRPAAANPDGGS